MNELIEKIAWQLDLKKYKQTLITGVLLILVAVPIRYIQAFQLQNLPKEMGMSKSIGSKALVQMPSAEELKKSFSESALFGNLEKQNPQVIKISLTQMLKDYRLKGIVLMDSPEAIIEDARTQKTTFVKKEQLLGEVKIKDIQEGFVIFAYGGEEQKVEIQ